MSANQRPWPEFTLPKGENVSRFAVEFEIANYWDLGQMEQRQLRPDQVRRLVVRGMVDTGADGLVLPKGVSDFLGLPEAGRFRVQYADRRRRVLRKRVQGAFVNLLGRTGVFSAMIEPARDSALIGALVLEELDLLVDCKRERLVPRDPEYVLREA